MGRRAVEEEIEAPSMDDEIRQKGIVEEIENKYWERDFVTSEWVFAIGRFPIGKQSADQNSDSTWRISPKRSSTNEAGKWNKIFYWDVKSRCEAGALFKAHTDIIWQYDICDVSIVAFKLRRVPCTWAFMRVFKI